jgi:quercetin dioxygenase-like cupin family protein
MDITEFERRLAADGFIGVLIERIPGEFVGDHHHDFDVRALVTDGEITLSVSTVKTTYKEGDVFALSSGCVHTEVIGDSGVTYLAGRRPN